MGTPNTLQVQVKTPNIGYATLSAANTAQDGSGSLSTIFTAGSNGSRADRIVVQPIGTNAATVLRVFKFDPTGSTNTLYKEFSIPASTLSQTQANTPTTIDLQTMALATGWLLKAAIGTAAAGGLSVTTEGGDF